MHDVNIDSRFGNTTIVVWIDCPALSSPGARPKLLSGGTGEAARIKELQKQKFYSNQFYLLVIMRKETYSAHSSLKLREVLEKLQSN